MGGLAEGVAGGAGSGGRVAPPGGEFGPAALVKRLRNAHACATVSGCWLGGRGSIWPAHG